MSTRSARDNSQVVDQGLGNSCCERRMAVTDPTAAVATSRVVMSPTATPAGASDSPTCLLAHTPAAQCGCCLHELWQCWLGIASGTLLMHA
jgi:hypothetical protein